MFEKSVGEQEIEQSDVLRVVITDASYESSFLLYNTHSLPVDAPITQSEVDELLSGRPIRFLRPGGDTFRIRYYKSYAPGASADITSRVLKNEISDQTILPRHTLQNPWDAPFFYEDPQHVFYVTTAAQTVLIPQWNSYSILPNSLQQQDVIPDLVLKRVEVLPDRLGLIALDAPEGVAGPAPIARFVSEDAYISRAIATTETVRFGATPIGPAGNAVNGM